MNASIGERFTALKRELQLHKNGFVAAVVIISLAMLAIGLFMPQNYESNALLFANLDDSIQNVLESGPGAVVVTDNADIAKEIIGTRRFVSRVVEEAGILDDDLSKVQLERELNYVRGQLGVSSKGKNYIEMSYVDTDPEVSFQVVSAAVSTFIEESLLVKKSESQKAFDFVDRQVTEYKNKLDSADQRLKQFQANHVGDGTRQAADDKISRLRADIEQYSLDIASAEVEQDQLRSEIGKETRILSNNQGREARYQHIQRMQTEVDRLLLSFTPTHPDVIALREQITELESGAKVADIAELSDLGTNSNRGGTLNPLYEELRKSLAAVNVTIKATTNRLSATENLLEEEYARLERIVGNETELTELSRDYETIQSIYNELLRKRENAHMALELEDRGQGVTYEIKEPPIFPLLPIGLRFIHFLIAGPILALLIPTALLFAYVHFDPRVRMPSIIQQQLRVPVLASVPHVSTRFRKGILKSELLPHFTALALVVVAYSAVITVKLVTSI